jgi:ribosome-binding protein aMBF1 (putative translation factor)
MLESWTRHDAAMQALLAEERSKAAVARQIYELRTARGLTQKQLAELLGTKQPVIARLEDADYQGRPRDAVLHRGRSEV